MIDFTSEPARLFWQAPLDRLVRDLGIRAFKLDYGEDIVPELGGNRIPLSFADGTSERETHNVYARPPYRRALDAGSSEGGFVLVRASCCGGQSVADIIWPGDIDSNLTRGDVENVGGLPAAISAMISLAASSFPSFASDTGGYIPMPAHDLETLVPAPTPMGAGRISPSDRPFLRARVIPMGASSIHHRGGRRHCH